jgi:hypothetical protein
MQNQYEVFIDIEPLSGEPFSINRDTDLDLRVVFNVQKDVRLDPAMSEIQIYNLNEAHEQALAFTYDIKQIVYGGKITVFAGYRGASKQIFSGNIVRSYTTPEGGDRVTYIQAMHLIQSMAGGFADRSFPKKTKPGNIISYLIDQFSDVSMSPDQRDSVNTLLKGQELKNSESFTGSALQELKRFSARFSNKVKIFFDETGPQFLAPGESNGDEPVILDKNSGLINSPQITDIGATVRMRLNPGLRNGTPVEVDSEVIRSLQKAPVGGVQQNKVGRYIAEKITHLGDNYPGGEWTTEIFGIYEGGALPT